MEIFRQMINEQIIERFAMVVMAEFLGSSDRKYAASKAVDLVLNILNQDKLAEYLKKDIEWSSMSKELLLTWSEQRPEWAYLD